MLFISFFSFFLSWLNLNWLPLAVLINGFSQKNIEIISTLCYALIWKVHINKGRSIDWLNSMFSLKYMNPLINIKLLWGLDIKMDCISSCSGLCRLFFSKNTKTQLSTQKPISATFPSFNHNWRISPKSCKIKPQKEPKRSNELTMTIFFTSDHDDGWGVHVGPLHEIFHIRGRQPSLLSWKQSLGFWESSHVLPV